jgi:c-di-GMP-binding flagellar brake protein YcgR
MYVDRGWSSTGSTAYSVKRREPRYVSSMPVAMQRYFRFEPFFSRGLSLDISIAGMSALLCGAPQIGEIVLIELMLPDNPIEMLATVRHSTDAKSGFEFYLSSPAATRGIQGWIQELRKHEADLFPHRYSSLF